MSSEIGKAGLLKATLEMIREKRSGTQPELFQVAIFALNRMCLLGKSSAILRVGVGNWLQKHQLSIATCKLAVRSDSDIILGVACRNQCDTVPQTVWGRSV